VLFKSVLDVDLVDGERPQEVVPLGRQERFDRLVVLKDLSLVVNLDHQDLDVNLVPRYGLQN